MGFAKAAITGTMDLNMRGLTVLQSKSLRSMCWLLLKDGKEGSSLFFPVESHQPGPRIAFSGYTRMGKLMNRIAMSSILWLG